MSADPVPVVAEVDLGTATLLPDLDRTAAYLLAVDGVPQSYVDLEDPAYLEFEYVRRLAHLVDVLEPGSILHLGGGGMSLPRYVTATSPRSRQQVVEADAALVDLVRRWLPFDPAIEVLVTDARAAVESLPENSADLVVADIFAGSQVPARVTSAEFLAQVARVLRPGGVYAANIADQAPFDFARAVAATSAATFAECHVAAEPGVLRGRRFGNLMLIGTDRRFPIGPLRRLLAGDPFPARLLTAVESRDFLGGAVPITDATAVPSPIPPEGTFTLP